LFDTEGGEEFGDRLGGEFDECRDEVGGGVEFGGIDPGEVDGVTPVGVDF
jgi:hypothetical protein